MKAKKFKSYILRKGKKRVDQISLFEKFMDDNPTRRQFGKFMMFQMIMPDHFWILSGRKL